MDRAVRRPRTVHRGVVEAIPLAAHGGLDAMEAEQLAVVTAGILHTAAGMVDPAPWATGGCLAVDECRSLA